MKRILNRAVSRVWFVLRWIVYMAFPLSISLFALWLLIAGIVDRDVKAFLGLFYAVPFAVFVIIVFLSEHQPEWHCVWHDWNGCRCRVCGETRDQEHDWDDCKCRVCGKTRDQGHQRDGCRCRVCGTSKKEWHDWDGCKCRVCGETRDQEHDWDDCKCRVCGQERHDWYEKSRETYETEPVYSYESGNQYLIDSGVSEEIITYRCRRCGEEKTETIYY